MTRKYRGEMELMKDESYKKLNLNEGALNLILNLFLCIWYLVITCAFISFLVYLVILIFFDS